MNNMNTIKSYGENKLILGFTEKCKVIPTNLLVIPHNLMGQWQSYIHKYSSWLEARTMFIFREKHIDKLLENIDMVHTNKLIVVTSTCYNKLAHILSSMNYKLQRVIFDEIDNINLPNCMCIDSTFYWFVTASYINLLYPKGFYRYDARLNKTVWYAQGLRNSGFVKNIFLDLYSSLSMDFVQILVLRNNDDYIRASVTLPPIQQRFVQCTSPIEISILNGFADYEVIRSLNARDLTSAIRCLKPSHMCTEENIVALQIAKFTQEIHNFTIRLQSIHQMTFDTEEMRSVELEKVQKKKDEIEYKVDGIKERIRNTNTCCICYETMCSKTIAPCCSNAFCFACLNIWLQKTKMCPMCKHVLFPKDLLVVDKETNENERGVDENEMVLDPRNDKLQNLEILLKTKMTSSSKVLIFSSYEMSFQSISNVVQKMGMTSRCLKGNDSQIRSMIKKYKEEDLNVLFINARNFGSGMNLENTTDIVLFHKMDTEIEKQVIGRAQRFGRTCPLKLWYLLHDNEMVNVGRSDTS
jgi:hypothetical protein